MEKYFGTITAGPALDRPPRGNAKLDGERIVEVSDRVPQERTYFAWQTPGYFEPGDAEMDLINSILTDGLSARLNKVLIYDKQLCSDVVSFSIGTELVGTFIIWTTARPGASLGQIEQIVTDEIARLAKDGPTQAELNRAKTKWEYQFVTGLERIGGFGGKADRLNQYNTYLGTPDKFEEDINRHRNATIESVRETSARWLNTRNRLLVRFHPEKSGRESTDAVDRAKMPPLGSDRPFNTPPVKSVKLDNGLEVFVIERSDLPKVAVSFITRAGAVNDPAGKDGLADLTVELMKRGTKTRKALEKKQRLDALSQDAQDPNAIATRVSQMLAFGNDHPYGHPDEGLPATVTRLTREDFAQFHNVYWKPASSALIFAGDITLAEATALAKEQFGTWSGAAPPPVTIPAPRPAVSGKVYLIDRQDAAQTVVNQILPAPPRKTDEYFALQLADAVWGGGFGTRLNLNLREEKGYSYGVFSFPSLYSKSGIWRSTGGVQTNKTKESVVEFVKELKFLAGEKPITDQELENAKANRVRGYAQQFESLNRINNQVVQLWVAGLPMTELQREPEELRKAPLSAVNSVAQKYAAPKGTILLLVGDRSKIEAGIRELNLGEIVILDVEGKPIAK